jgi:hypothetical protein
MTPRLLFHASHYSYAVGQSLGPIEKNFFAQKRDKDITFAKLEDQFEKLRPRDAHSRRSAYYACESLSECAAYLLGEEEQSVVIDGGRGQTRKYYRVEMERPLRTAMALVYRASTKRNDAATLQSIIREYWHPTKSWAFWEFLSPCMKVVEVCSNPGLIEVAVAWETYRHDSNLAKELFP